MQCACTPHISYAYPLPGSHRYGQPRSSGLMECNRQHQPVHAHLPTLLGPHRYGQPLCAGLMERNRQHQPVRLPRLDRRQVLRRFRDGAQYREHQVPQRSAALAQPVGRHDAHDHHNEVRPSTLPSPPPFCPRTQPIGLHGHHSHNAEVCGRLPSPSPTSSSPPPLSPPFISCILLPSPLFPWRSPTTCPFPVPTQLLVPFLLPSPSPHSFLPSTLPAGPATSRARSLPAGPPWSTCRT